jgi:hypothetical protein
LEIPPYHNTIQAGGVMQEVKATNRRCKMDGGRRGERVIFLGRLF